MHVIAPLIAMPVRCCFIDVRRCEHRCVRAPLPAACARSYNRADGALLVHQRIERGAAAAVRMAAAFAGLE
jgi:hypothetical protein